MPEETVSKIPKVLLLYASGRISQMLIVVLFALSLLGHLMIPLTSHAQESGPVLLKCDSPLDCNLRLDGEGVGVIPAGKLKKVSWELGEHILEVSVVDNRFSTRFTEKIITVTPLQTVVKLTPYILLNEVLKAAMKGTVVTVTTVGGYGEEWQSYVKGEDYKDLTFESKGEDYLSWTNDGFAKCGLYGVLGEFLIPAPSALFHPA